MSCSVCSAPALELDGACVFCRSPLRDSNGADAALLEYLAQRLPVARARRQLLRRRRQVRALSVRAGGESFTACLRKDGLELQPELEAPLWVDRLLAALSRDAAGEAEVRDAVIHAGWRLR